MKKILIVILVMLLTSCSSNNDNNQNTIKLDGQTQQSDETKISPTPESQPKENAENKFSLGETITVDGFELTFGDQISIYQIENRYSDDNGKDVLGIPVHVKNSSGETGNVNQFYLSVFGPDGNETMTTTLVENNDMLGYDGDLRDGAEKDSIFYFMYTGDGEYVIEFDDYTSKGEISFNVTK